LDSWLKTDPWDDKVHQLNAKIYAPMNARDKMPFEVTPIFYKLQRYDVSRVTTPAASASGTAAPPPASDQPAAKPNDAPSSPPAEQAPAGDTNTTQQQPPAAAPNQ
jgi:hypothetical protein